MVDPAPGASRNPAESAGVPPAAPNDPIIVGGCPRSGTTVVRRALDRHSRIHCPSEVRFFNELDEGFPESFLSTAGVLAPREGLIEVLGRALVDLHVQAARWAGKPRWADKNPSNAVHLDDWSRLLGDRWQYVHVVRNPLDTIASIAEAGFPNLPEDLEARVDHYRRMTMAGLLFAGRFPERSHVLIYERLAAAPTETLGELMDFLGERFEPGQLEVGGGFTWSPVEFGDPKILRTARIHSDSVHAWRHRLSPDEAELVWARAVDVWELVDPDDRWVAPPD